MSRLFAFTFFGGNPANCPIISIHSSPGELYDQIRLRGKLPEGDAARYAAEVVAVLGVMRGRAVVHRDLKPENLLLDGEGHLKLIDFGSAKQLAPEEAVPQPQPAAPAAAADVAAEAPSGGGEAAGDAAQPASEGSHGALDGDGEQGGEDSVEGHQGSVEGHQGSAEGQPGEGGGIRAVSLVGTADYVSPEVGLADCCACCCSLLLTPAAGQTAVLAAARCSLSRLLAAALRGADLPAGASVRLPPAFRQPRPGTLCASADSWCCGLTCCRC